MSRLSEDFYANINSKILIISIVIFIAFMIFVLPAVSEASDSNIGVSVSPDQSFFYNSDDLYEMAELYGEEGRRYYIKNRFSFDIIWPLVYGFFILSSLTMLLKQKSREGWLRKLNLLPLAAVLFDFMENIGASVVMYRYPQQTPVIAEITPLFTTSKWLVIGFSFLLLFVMLFGLFLKRLYVFTKSKKKTFLIVFFIIIIVFIAGFFFYVQSYYPAEIWAMEALKSDQMMDVTTEGPFTLFKPVNSHKTAFVFYPGGKVDHQAYAPVLRMIADEGYPVVLVEMPFRLAVFGPNRATDAMNLFPEATHFVIGGHSLGGAMAASYAGNYIDTIDGLLLWASYSNIDLRDSGLTVGSIYGDRDGLISTEQINETAKKLPEDAFFYRISGGNHAGFGAYGPQEGDLERTITTEEQRTLIADYSIDFLEKFSE